MTDLLCNCGHTLGQHRSAMSGPEECRDCACHVFIERPGQEEPVEAVDHPAHYGGADNPYEAIKVIEAWALGFNLGNAVKYISRAGRKGDAIEDLKKAPWYLDREVTNREEAKLF